MTESLDDSNKTRFRELTDPSIVQGRVTRVVDESWNATQFLYTPEWREAKACVRSGHRNAIEAAVVFLEIDPWCLYSGYEKEDLYRALAEAPLSESDKARLREVVLRRLAERRGRSNATLRRLAHLANAVWTPTFGDLMTKIHQAHTPTHPDRELRFLAFAEHGYQASVRWGVEHRPDHPAALPIHRPEARHAHASSASTDQDRSAFSFRL